MAPFEKSPRNIFIVASSFVLGIIFFISYIVLFTPPSDFPKGAIVTIPQGVTLRQTAQLLADEHIVSSETFFTILVSLFAGTGVKAGDYMFAEPQQLLTVAWRVSRGDFRLTPIRITFPEGITVREIGNLCVASLPHCKSSDFAFLTKNKEGYLFPDTYDFLPTVGAQDVVIALEKNFNDKIAPLLGDIKKSKKSLADIITMASLVEAEARTPETRRMVAGILWKRISIGMPLQVDAPFKYINGKDTYTLVTEDLSVDSPYNTYLHKGLPKGPINNPGLDAILATLNPTVSPYLYYLTDKKGTFYYARTHEEHLLNKEKYLGN